MTAYPLTVEGLSAACRSLDLESWEIADIARAKGIKGTPGNECRCLLAALFMALIPGASLVYVEAEFVRVEGYMRDEFGFDWPVVLTAQLPDGAQDLIQEFDRGEHPDLEEAK